MTCIAALVDKGTVYMGADSMGTSDDDAYDAVFPKKIFRIDDMLIGVAGSLRIIQLLQYAWDIPDRGNLPANAYMVAVAESIRHLLSDVEASSTVDGTRRVYEGMVMIGYEGKIYRIFSDFAVTQTKQDYATIGSGGQVASGSLFSTKGMEPKKRIQLALNAAAQHISSVRGPFTIEKLETRGGSRGKVKGVERP